MSELLANATSVAVAGRALLIMGAPGSGKSSLALALIDRGAVLVGDDGVALTRQGDRLIASPPPRIAGLIEVRNVGLIRLPTTSAPLALAIRLSHAAARLPEAAIFHLLGAELPLVELWPDSPALPLRATWALTEHGLV